MDSRFSSGETYPGSDTPNPRVPTPWQSEPWPILTEPPTGSGMSYYDQYGSGNARQYPSMAGDQDSRRRRGRSAWWSAVVLILAVVRLLSHLGGSGSTSTTTTSSAFVFPGVNICGLGNASFFPLGCLSSDSSVAAKSGAMVCYTGLDGATFTGTTVGFTVQRLGAKGKVLAHGTSRDTVDPTESSSCSTLDNVIHTAKLTLTPGSYAIDAKVAGTDLGRTTFTLTAPVK